MSRSSCTHFIRAKIKDGNKHCILWPSFISASLRSAVLALEKELEKKLHKPRLTKLFINSVLRSYFLTQNNFTSKEKSRITEFCVALTKIDFTNLLVYKQKHDEVLFLLIRGTIRFILSFSSI